MTLTDERDRFRHIIRIMSLRLAFPGMLKVKQLTPVRRPVLFGNGKERAYDQLQT